MKKHTMRKVMLRLTAGLLGVILSLGMTACHAAATGTAQTPQAAAVQSPVSTTPAAPYDGYREQKDLAVQALIGRLEEGRDGMYVYRDFSEQVNSYTQRAKMEEYGAVVKEMDENWTVSPYAGNSCIRCEVSTSELGWGGWLFLTGTLEKGSTVPKLNTGERPGEGLDLTGADSLRFRARGEKGGEVVEFFTCGFGYDGANGRARVPHPDSAQKQTLGYVKLTKDWTAYEIPLKGVDLSDITCGFGFVCSGTKGRVGTNIFYLDEIKFTGTPARAQSAPMLLRSYDTDSVYLKNTAFTYDNAVAAMAFLSEGRQEEAKAILDALVYAVEHDRYASGTMIRNAYAAADLRSAPGWDAGANLPGWYDRDAGAWYEDRYQVGSNTGNTAYAALALLQYEAAYGCEKYLKTAAALMDWVLNNCTDDTCGFTAGYDGWPEGDQPVVYPLTYKSVEHNIDAYAAFVRLYDRLGEQKYKDAADSALAFLRSMYDAEKGVFYTGTGADGCTADKGNIVLDAQVWSAMALDGAFEPYAACLEQVKTMALGGAYPFCQNNENGGWWPEGTAFTALMFREQGNDEAAVAALDQLCGVQMENGLFPAAAGTERLSTGIDLFTGEPWEYSTDPHIVPTAWFILAVNSFDPYRF